MIALFVAELYRTLILITRYPVAFFMDIVMNFGLFSCLFAGVSYFAGNQTTQFGYHAAGMALGFFIWLLTTIGFGHVTKEIETDAHSGTLENIFLSSYSTEVVFIIRAFSGVLICVVHYFFIIPLVMYSTGIELSFPLEVFLPFLTIITATCGIGLMVGGGALIFKRFGDILMPINYAVLFVLMIPPESWPVWMIKMSSVLPGVPGVILLRDIMVFEKGVNPEIMLIALLNAGLYLLIGMLVFHKMVIMAKRRGLVGGY